MRFTVKVTVEDDNLGNVVRSSQCSTDLLCEGGSDGWFVGRAMGEAFNGIERHLGDMSGVVRAFVSSIQNAELSEELSDRVQS